jgi:hypothetical protein
MFWSATHYAYATFQQSVAGMLSFWGVYLNLMDRYFHVDRYVQLLEGVIGTRNPVPNYLQNK